MNADPALDTVRRGAIRFEPTTDGIRPLLDAIGKASLVLIGEATHGTHESARKAARSRRPSLGDGAGGHPVDRRAR
jgi:erythromycin esterase-like protein